MKLTSPCIITSRLLPGVRIANAEISIEYSNQRESDGRTRFKYYIDLPNYHYANDDLRSGCQGGTLAQGLETLLSFMSACGESYRYSLDHSAKGENLDLFPPALAEWCYINDTEIELTRMEIEENLDCINES